MKEKHIKTLKTLNWFIFEKRKKAYHKKKIHLYTWIKFMLIHMSIDTNLQHKKYILDRKGN